MEGSSPYNWQESFEQQKAEFVERSRERLLSMEALIEAITVRPSDVGMINKLSRHFHQLAGSGSLYEMNDVSQTAIAGEELCSTILNQERDATKEDLKNLSDMRLQLKRLLSSDQVSVKHFVQAFEMPEKAAHKTQVVLVTANPKIFNVLTGSLEEKGVAVLPLRTSSSFNEYLQKQLPDALIIDLPLPDGPGYDLATAVRQTEGGQDVPIIILSQETGFLNKVQAIRSGADAIFDHPIEIDAVYQKLTTLLGKQSAEDYRILYVEDDPSQASFYQKLLNSLGYDIMTLDDPAQFEETLLKFAPHLLLLDIMLGEINGIELARYVRQNERFAAVPIIFLTTQNQLNAHIASARAGGDDHLIKPVAPQLLVATIAGRLERYQTLKRLIGHDGLTGCLSHGSFMDEASKLCSNDMRRFNAMLLLVNIDKLGQINEQFGFAAGDRIIASLANLIRNTFRQTASIGRVGGNAFAIVTESLEELEIADLANQVLKEFAAIEHMCDGQIVRATASAAITPRPEGRTINQWLTAAEAKIHQAKKSGGNTLVRAEAPQQWQWQ